MKRFIFLIVLAVLSLAPAVFAHDAEYDQIAAEAQLGKRQVADLTSKLFVYRLAVQKVEADYEARISAGERRYEQEHADKLALAKKIDDHKNDWFGPRAHRWFIGIGILIALAVLCKIGAQVWTGGIFGAVLSWTGEGLLAVATLGVSTISTVFNNLWFRFGSQGKSIVASFVAWLKSFFSHKTPAAPATST